MTEPASCPTPACWQGLLSGALAEDDQAVLSGHLETCAHCQQTLEQMAAGSAAWSAAARHLGNRRADEEGLHRILAELEAEADLPSAPEGAEAQADVSLDFLDPPAKPGQLGRLGHYEVLEFLGHGGMGVVLKAFDQALHRVVAVKVMAPQLASSATARQRFVREARAAAAVRNEYVVDIHAVAEANGLPYLVMEYVAGPSLQQRLHRTGPLELKEILRIGMQAACGLAAAHAQGLIHRDIKPANILLENGVERVKITDFGLARAAADATLSSSGVVAGTPHYMAPEQARGEAVDYRADLFSLGSVLYAMCTGRHPFRAGGALAVLKRVCEDTPRPIREINPEIPVWLAAIIEKLHAKDPAARFASAAEVAELLGQHLAHLQQPALVPLPQALSGGRSSGRKRSPRRRWALAAAVLLALVGGLSLTEAAGVTRLAASVVRIFTPEGTLVVEVEDPAVTVTVEGDGGIVITGAGPREVRLRPGSYRLQASKDGQPVPVDRELVTISRGDKQVVKVRHEGADPAQAATEIRRFGGHRGPVWKVTFAGTRVVTAGADSWVRVWDRDSGKELQRFDGHKQGVYGLAVSPDGRRILSGSGNPDADQQPVDWSICLWELENGKELRRLEGRGGAITSVAFSRDGRRALFGNYLGTVQLWDVEAWKEIRRLDHSGGLWSVCFSPDGSKALTAGGFNNQALMCLWDLETGQELRRFEGHKFGTWQATFLPHGRSLLSGGLDETLRHWDADSSRQLHRLNQEGQVRTLAPSSDGRFVLVSTHNHLRLWRLESAEEVQVFKGHDKAVLAVALSPDDRYALSGGADGSVRLWKMPSSIIKGK